MGRHDWYRRQTWSPRDAEDFFQRLSRSRTDSNKAQYLCIQAGHLAEVGLHKAALMLLSQFLEDYSTRIFLASAHLQRAECYLALGNDEERAIACYREALLAEVALPNVQCGSSREFAWFIVTRGRTELYGEVEALLRQHEERYGVTLPTDRFKCAVARAIVAQSEGRMSDARRFAAEARTAANVQHSGFRHHPDVGLVGNVPPDVAQRLELIERD